MDFTLILFIVLAITAVATAAGLLMSRNAVYAALFLVLNFACVAVFYLILGAPFIALAQATIYAGAIMVLFLFVIMLLGAEKLPRGQVLPWQRPMAIVLAAVLVIVALMNFTRRDIAFTAVILWALVGISVKHAAVSAVALPTWITFGLVALTLVIAFFLPRTEKVVR